MKKFIVILGGVLLSLTIHVSAQGKPASSEPTQGLPPGITLDPATGTLTGSPTAFGIYQFTVKACDTENPPQCVTKVLGILIYGAVMITSTDPLAAGVVAIPYSQTLNASGGTGTYTWSVVP